MSWPWEIFAKLFKRGTKNKTKLKGEGKGNKETDVEKKNQKSTKNHNEKDEENKKTEEANENKQSEKENENKDNKNSKENNKFKDNKESKETKVEKNNRKLAENHNEKDEKTNGIKEIKESKETEVEKNNRKLAAAHDEANKQKIEKYRNVLDVILDSMDSAINAKDMAELSKVCEHLLKLLSYVNKLYVDIIEKNIFTTPTTELLSSLSNYFQTSDTDLDRLNLAQFIKCLGNIECDPKDYKYSGLAKNCGLFLPEQQKKMFELYTKAKDDIYGGNFRSVYENKNVKESRQSSSLLIGAKELHAYCSGEPIKKDSTPEYILNNVIGKEIEPNLLKIKEQLENEIKNLSNSKEKT